jgi:hypothetical protein
VDSWCLIPLGRRLARVAVRPLKPGRMSLRRRFAAAVAFQRAGVCASGGAKPPWPDPLAPRTGGSSSKGRRSWAPRGAAPCPDPASSGARVDSASRIESRRHALLFLTHLGSSDNAKPKRCTVVLASHRAPLSDVV